MTTAPSLPTIGSMATEPARQIGESFASKYNIRLLLVAVFGLLATVGVNVAPDVPGQVEAIINYGAPLAIAGYAKWQLTRSAKAQAEATRDAVIAPATAQRLVRQAAQTGDPTIIV